MQSSWEYHLYLDPTIYFKLQTKVILQMQI